MADQGFRGLEDEPISLDPEVGQSEPVSMARNQAKSSDDGPISLEPEAGGAPAAAEQHGIRPSAGASAAGIGKSSSKAQTFGAGLAQAVHHFDFKRPMNVKGTGATRCRVFHSKVAEAPLQVMENHINEWLDAEEIEVKYVGHVVGAMQGKSTEPNVIVLVWY